VSQHHWQNSPFWATTAFLKRFCQICPELDKLEFENSKIWESKKLCKAIGSHWYSQSPVTSHLFPISCTVFPFSAHPSIMKMKVAGSSDMLVLIYWTIWHHIIEKFQNMQDLRFSQWCLRGAPPSGMSCHVVWYKLTDVLEACWWTSTRLHSFTSHKMVLFKLSRLLNMNMSTYYARHRNASMHTSKSKNDKNLTKWHLHFGITEKFVQYKRNCTIKNFYILNIAQWKDIYTTRFLDNVEAL
jgi:hypothetical protein